MKNCECIGWVILGPQDRGEHHHVNCPKYGTEKFPMLMYYEEAVNAWIPAPNLVENIIEADQLESGEDVELRFKRVDFTDAELAALPDD